MLTALGDHLSDPTSAKINYVLATADYDTPVGTLSSCSSWTLFGQENLTSALESALTP